MASTRKESSKWFPNNERQKNKIWNRYDQRETPHTFFAAMNPIGRGHCPSLKPVRHGKGNARNSHPSFTQPNRRTQQGQTERTDTVAASATSTSATGTGAAIPAGS
ncbi:hypothetical protein M0804_000127 [Polistes exclamans]|nr:hypothetical protein M0804_000127 [Polistes exclamans]